MAAASENVTAEVNVEVAVEEVKVAQKDVEATTYNTFKQEATNKQRILNTQDHINTVTNSKQKSRRRHTRTRRWA
jgi:Skp family chaperone for outer membrane proteins